MPSYPVAAGQSGRWSRFCRHRVLNANGVCYCLAWLTLARADQLRRLQMAAAEHAKLLFVLRPASALGESSPAALRLVTSNPPEGNALMVNILKRRGPPLTQTLALLARHARLPELLGDVLDSQPDHSHALDSTAAAAA